MSTASATGLMTAEEFFDWAIRPEFDDRRFELDRGRPVERRRFGGARHGTVCGLVNYVFGHYLFAQLRCGYGISNNTGLVAERNPDTVFGPDFMAFARPRTEPLSNWFVSSPPDVVVDVLDDGDETLAMHARAERLFPFGMPMVWLVCSESFTVTVIRPNRPSPILACGDTLTDFPELPGFTCPVAALFTLPGQQPPTATP